MNDGIQAAVDLAAVLENDGVVCFASAAALTLGAFTAPVYEIYKAGVPEPYWLDGLDLMGRAGLRCAVVSPSVNTAIMPTSAP